MKIVKLKAIYSREIVQTAKILSKWFTKQAITNIKRACNKQNGFVALDNNKIVGFLLYRKWKETAIITWMGILPNYQGEGIGRNLLKSLENKLKKYGVRKLKVSTLAPTTKYKPYEKTRKFYLKTGFKKYKIDKKFYPDGSDRLVLLKIVS